MQDIDPQEVNKLSILIPKNIVGIIIFFYLKRSKELQYLYIYERFTVVTLRNWMLVAVHKRVRKLNFTYFR